MWVREISLRELHAKVDRMAAAERRMLGNAARALTFQLVQPAISSRAERPGLVPQLVFKTSTAS